VKTRKSWHKLFSSDACLHQGPIVFLPYKHCANRLFYSSYYLLYISRRPLWMHTKHTFCQPLTLKVTGMQRQRISAHVIQPTILSRVFSHNYNWKYLSFHDLFIDALCLVVSILCRLLTFSSFSFRCFLFPLLNENTCIAPEHNLNM